MDTFNGIQSKLHQKSCENAELDLFLPHRAPHSDGPGSLSDDESDGDHDSSEDEYEDIGESENEDNLDDWVSDLTRQEAPDDSQLHEGPGHEIGNGSIAASTVRSARSLPSARPCIPNPRTHR